MIPIYILGIFCKSVKRKNSHVNTTWEFLNVLTNNGLVLFQHLWLKCALISLRK